MPDQFDGLRMKSREISSGHLTVTWGRQGGLITTGGGPTQWSKTYPQRSGSQVTLTDGHPWPPLQRSLEDVGGPFRSTRTFIALTPTGKPVDWDQIPRKRVWSNGWLKPPSTSSYPIGYMTEGEFLPQQVNLQNYWRNVNNPASDQDRLIALGTTAIARCKPTNPAADLSVTLGEFFREGLPAAPGVTTWKSRSEIAKGAGSEYLNTVFGWAPLVNDIQAVAKAARNQDKIWRQYQRDAGRVVRRRYRFPTEKSSEIVRTESNRVPWPAPSIYEMKYAGSQLKVIRTTERRVWFSGAFTYYLPKAGGEGVLNDWLSSLSRLKAVYGLTLTPETVWNLTPWTWAADWFANTGNVISNISDLMTDGLVMHYGYLMEHVREVDEISLTGCTSINGDDISDLRLYVVRETKQRIKASPYGFGLTWDGFSPKQVAILAALGISR